MSHLPEVVPATSQVDEAVIGRFPYSRGGHICATPDLRHPNGQSLCISHRGPRAPDHILIRSHGSRRHLLGLLKGQFFAKLHKRNKPIVPQMEGYRCRILYCSGGFHQHFSLKIAKCAIIQSLRVKNAFFVGMCQGVSHTAFQLPLPKYGTDSFSVGFFVFQFW